MNKIEFNHNTCSWDAYRRPYMGIGRWRSYHAHDDAPFILFDTGEVIAKYTGWNKDRRHRYSDLGVTVFNTIDADAPSLYDYTNKAVPRAHLTCGGGQDLLLDEATGSVVGCGRSLPDGNLKGRWREDLEGRQYEIPSYFWTKHQLSVYWAGAGREPVGSRIKVVRPIKRSKEERKHIRDLRNAAAAWRYLQPEKAKQESWSKQPYSYPSTSRIGHETLLKLKSFADMDEKTRWRLEGWPVVADYETVYVDRLKIKQ